MAMAASQTSLHCRYQLVGKIGLAARCSVGGDGAGAGEEFFFCGSQTISALLLF
jgi:hypothetical protein